jgi:GNAT superfamily N-acetyltransferase
MVMAEIDGRLVGYGRVEPRRQVDRSWVFEHLGFLHPGHRRRGIGSAMLGWLQRRARDMAAERRAEGPRSLQSDAQDTEVGTVALLTARGYEPVRHDYEMLRPTLDDIPDLPLPEGLEVRPVEREHLRAIWEASIEAFRDHWGATERTEADYEWWLSHPITFRPDLWRVAWDGDEVAGQVRSFIDHAQNTEFGRKRGYTEYISTRRPWRRRGLARALIAQSLHALREAGMQEAALGVDTENPTGALRIYESVGFRPIRSGATYRRRLD